mmetsp:Transcript_23384/g.66461  ORF Transcript_23384/g.66461 Transcript_23384/m.66461 type:complete len:271 (-) Transcript_23384:324-1136(-)
METLRPRLAGALREACRAGHRAASAQWSRGKGAAEHEVLKGRTANLAEDGLLQSQPVRDSASCHVLLRESSRPTEAFPRAARRKAWTPQPPKPRMLSCRALSHTEGADVEAKWRWMLLHLQQVRMLRLEQMPEAAHRTSLVRVRARSMQTAVESGLVRRNYDVASWRPGPELTSVERATSHRRWSTVRWRRRRCFARPCPSQVYAAWSLQSPARLARGPPERETQRGESSLHRPVGKTRRIQRPCIPDIPLPQRCPPRTFSRCICGSCCQ